MYCETLSLSHSFFSSLSAIATVFRPFLILFRSRRAVLSPIVVLANMHNDPAGSVEGRALQTMTQKYFTHVQALRNTNSTSEILLR